MTLNVKLLDERAQLPTYGSELSSGMDLYSIEDVTLEPGETKLVRTGIGVELVGDGDEYELQVRPRSGLALKESITVLNSPGTVDFDYRGEVGVILHNTTRLTLWQKLRRFLGLEEYVFEVLPGDRIAQLVACPIARPTVTQVTELSLTTRNTGAYGSTGK